VLTLGGLTWGAGRKKWERGGTLVVGRLQGGAKPKEGEDRWTSVCCYLGEEKKLIIMESPPIAYTY